MIPWLYLGIIAAAVIGFQVFVASVKEEGRVECNAIHLEAARLGEKKARERANTAAGKHEADRTKARERERTVAPEVARVAADPGMAATCISADGLRILHDDVSQHGTAAEPEPAVPATPGAAPR